MSKIKRIVKNIVSLSNREIPIEYLQKRGLKIGENFTKQQGCFIDPSHCFLIEIGNNVTFSIRVTLLAHDASCKNIVNYTKIGKIKIEDNVFVGANVTILPNVTIGENSIIGAGSVVTKDIPTNCVAAGNPAKIIMTIDEYKSKLESKMEKAKKFGEEYTVRKNVNEEKKEEMRQCLEKYGIGFIK